jgi:two-component system response regulator FixJ
LAFVFIIDDQQSVRDALNELLSVYGYATRTFASAHDFLAEVDAQASGCVVSDVRMPDMDGIALVREMGRRALGLPVVLISGHADVPMAVAAIKAGADDFIEKPVDDVKLVAAINRSLGGLRQARQTSARLFEHFAQLTPREVEIFDLLVLGLTSPAIAERLQISGRTVESHRTHIMSKMDAQSVAMLVRQAIRIGRLEP